MHSPCWPASHPPIHGWQQSREGMAALTMAQTCRLETGLSANAPGTLRHKKIVTHNSDVTSETTLPHTRKQRGRHGAQTWGSTFRQGSQHRGRRCHVGSGSAAVKGRVTISSARPGRAAVCSVCVPSSAHAGITTTRALTTRPSNKLSD